MRQVQKWTEKVHLKIEYFSEILGKFADTKFRLNLPKMVCFEFFWCNGTIFAENSEILLQNMYLDIKNFGHLKFAKFRRFRRKMVPLHHWSSKTTQFWGVRQKIDSNFCGFLTYYFPVLKTSLFLRYQKINDIILLKAWKIYNLLFIWANIGVCK